MKEIGFQFPSIDGASLPTTSGDTLGEELGSS
jgi:hypothetical protein